MHKQLFFFLLLGMVLLGIAGCDTLSTKVKGEGPVVEADLTPTTTITKLLISIPGNVYITEGETTKVTLIAQENVQENIKVNINGSGTLGYTMELTAKKPIKSYDSLALYITLPDLINLSVNSNAVVEGTNDWDFPLLTMTLNGSGGISIPRLTSDYLAMDLTGSGTVTIGSGIVGDLTVKSSSSGIADLMGMRSQNATITMSGSGLIRVNPVQTLSVTISGSGKVEYKGNPAVEQTITGTGTLTKL